MHLTNYSINKYNPMYKQNFKEGGCEGGNKRSIK